MEQALLSEPADSASEGPGSPLPESESPLDPRRASYNPATGALLGHVPLVGREGIDAALRSAHEAQREWATRSPHRRALVLEQFREALVEEMDAVARLISMEQGKPVTEAMSIEILSLFAQLRWLVNEGVRLLEGRRAPLLHPLFTAKEARYMLEPLGVIAVISPWNYPFALPGIQILSALLAGNGVLFKPSPYTPLVAQKIAELLRRTEIPVGLLTVVHIDDADAPYLTSHPAVNKIIFTGSVETGRRVMASAAQVPTPVVLELGGKDAAVVLPDADLERAAQGILWYGLANSGQTCAAVERVFVHEAVYDPFIRRLTALAERLTVGDGLRRESQMGPLTTEQQLAIVEEQVEEARALGANVLLGGHRIEGSGLFYAPTILADVTPEMRVMREETFGPVLPVMRVNSLEEAVTLVNGSGYALTASVWTRKKKVGLELAERLRAGAVHVNDHAFHFGEPGAAWGGVGQSGFGRTHGEMGLLEMVNLKYISADMRRGALEPWWYPYDEQTAHFLRNAARLLYGPSSRRLWALLSLLLNPRTWSRVNLVRFAREIRKWL